MQHRQSNIFNGRGHAVMRRTGAPTDIRKHTNPLVANDIKVLITNPSIANIIKLLMKSFKTHKTKEQVA